MTRISVAALATVSFVALSALTGCSAAVGENCAPDGAASKGITVSPELGTEPTVEFGDPLTVSSTERTVVTAGSGDVVDSGDTVKMHFALYNGTTGDYIEASNFLEGGETAFPVDTAATQFVGIAKVLNCTTVGSRVVGVIPNAEGFGESAVDAGLGAEDVLVIVADVVSIVPAPLAEATGEVVAPVDGFPAVEYVDGTVTVDVDTAAVPTEFALETLIKGAGEVVADGATVVVNYHGVNMNTGVVFDSSFDRGTPATFNVNQVIQGFHDAIVGQTIGSRVVVIIPADLGYGDEGSGDLIAGGDTLLFVVDILGLS
ncbi:peptidylprolyl isomerase [Microbacteriaceae bacterium MWH-Ta3]|nr:peptidylprolyl isomerase [Microbacteriaceae bacterium MWH-Ta3]